MFDASDFVIRTRADLADAVERFGFVPFFKNRIRGFSLAEHCAPEAWFSDDEGVWEWKGPVIRESGCAYGKLFENKAAFVRTDIYVELARAYTLSYRTIQNIITAERKAAGRTATEDMAIAQRAAERR